jgi:mycothiol system anti-sigma-R factor
MKPKCSKAQAQVYTYLDGEMTWYRRTRIWWHLRRCPPCADGFSFEEHLKHRIHDGCLEDVPEELIERLRAFLREQGPTGESPVKGA